MSTEPLDTDEEQQIEAQTQAILDAKFASIGQLKLLPFSANRAIVAQAMGYRGRFIGDHALEQYRQTGIYPGAVRDVAIYFWIRADLEAPSGYRGDYNRDRIARASWRPSEAQETAFQWAGENGLVDESSPKFLEAFALMLKLQSEEAEAQPVAAESDGDGKKKA